MIAWKYKRMWKLANHCIGEMGCNKTFHIVSPGVFLCACVCVYECGWCACVKSIITSLGFKLNESNKEQLLIVRFLMLFVCLLNSSVKSTQTRTGRETYCMLCMCAYWCLGAQYAHTLTEYTCQILRNAGCKYASITPLLDCVRVWSALLVLIGAEIVSHT